MWTIIIGMALGTFMTRFLFIGLADRYNLPKSIEHALSFAPPVVLTAIVTLTMSDMASKTENILAASPIFISVAVAMILTKLRGNLLLSIACGLSIYAFCKTILP